MVDPSFMQMTARSAAFPKVVVILATDSGHDRLETGQLVLQVLQSVVENVYRGVLLPNYLTKVATLTES